MCNIFENMCIYIYIYMCMCIGIRICIYIYINYLTYIRIMYTNKISHGIKYVYIYLH